MEVFINDVDLALNLHERIWEEIQEDLALEKTRNRVKPLVERYGGMNHRLLQPDAEHWDRYVILPQAQKEWPEYIKVLRKGWPSSTRKHPPVTRLAVLLWVEQLHYPDLGETTLMDLQDLFPERSAEATRQAEYRWRCRDLLRGQIPGVAVQIVSTPIRSARARQAVLYRDEYTCRNPHCTGQPYDKNDRDIPLLHVDHVLGLGELGPDDPRNMITLCPNCHAVKTHGQSRKQLSVELSKIARQRHAATWGD